MPRIEADVKAIVDAMYSAPEDTRPVPRDIMETAGGKFSAAKVAGLLRNADRYTLNLLPVLQLGLERVKWQDQRIKDLEAAIKKTHAAKGRYHSQISMCDLYDLVGLPNTRPEKDKGND